MNNPVGKMLALVCVVFVAMTSGDTVGASMKSKAPIASIDLTIDEGAQGEFVEQLHRFAEANSFEVRVGPSFKPGVDLSVHLLRAEIYLHASNPFDPRKIGVGFYLEGDNPVPPDSVNIDALVESFINFASAVSGATVTKIEK